MAADYLKNALKAVNWSKNVTTFLADDASIKSIENSAMRLAVWSKQLENNDKGNPALCFVREMQMAAQYVAVLNALALYKPAAASMRAMVETALYYSYFRTHADELATLVRNPKYYIGKQEVVDFHREHTAGFGELQQKLGMISALEDWYRLISGIVHGQTPGVWINHTSIADTKYSKATSDEVIKSFQDGVEIVHRLFLCTVGRVLWDGFSKDAKSALLSGLHGDIKQALGLELA